MKCKYCKAELIEGAVYCGWECEETHLKLRDQFAMAALTGLMVGVSIYNSTAMAESAYKLADAMLKEREK